MKQILNLRKLYIYMTLFVMMICTACDYKSDDPKDEAGKSDFVVLCSTFSAYDWARELVGDIDFVRVELLVDNGVDLHSYQPKAKDILRIANCDVFIYVGGESDAWVTEAIEQSANENLVALSMIEMAEDCVLEEEEIEGASHELHQTEEIEYDEHVWLSPKNAIIICEKITDELIKLDKDNQEEYNQNLEEYKNKLQELDEEYTALLDSSMGDTIMVGDRFPFLYLVKEYGIRYYAAYSGCSADAESSVHMVSYLAERMKEENIPVIFTVDNGNDDLCKTVIECQSALEGNASVEVLNLNSMQSVTKQQIEDGVTYITIMEENLHALKLALSN